MNMINTKTTQVTTGRRSLNRIVSWHSYDGGMWVRIFGRGASVVDKHKHPPLFSERNGYRKVLRIGKWRVEYLRANAAISDGGSVIGNDKK